MSIVTQIFNLKENSNLISGTIQIQKNKFFIEYILNFKVKKDYNSNLLMSIPEGFNIYKSIHVPMTVRFVNSKINNETKAESTIGLLLFDHINKQITFWDIGNVTQSDYPPQTSAMIFFAHFFTFVK